MRTIMLASVVCASALAAGPTTTADPAPVIESHSKPKPAASGKRTFHPLVFLRQLGAAESKFGLRLSSLGIRHETEAGSHALPLSTPSAEIPTLKLQGQAFDPGAAFWRLPGMIEVKEGSAPEPEVSGDEVANSSLGCALYGLDGGQ